MLTQGGLELSESYEVVVENQWPLKQVWSVSLQPVPQPLPQPCGCSWRLLGFTTSRLAEIRLKGALPQPTALYGEERDVPENHGVPGSSPGPATPKTPAKHQKTHGPRLSAGGRLLHPYCNPPAITRQRWSSSGSAVPRLAVWPTSGDAATR